MNTQNMPENKKIKFILQFIFIFICLSFIVRYFAANKNEFLLIKNISIVNALSLTVLFILTNLTASYKMLLILKNLGLKEIKFSKWFKIFAASRFINFHVTQGANLYRIAILKKYYNFSYPKGISMAIYFTWLEIVMILTATLIYTKLFTNDVDTAIVNIQNLLFLGIILILVLPFLINRLFKIYNPQNKHLAWVKEKLVDIVGSIMLQIRNHQLIKNFTLLSIVSYFLCFAIVYLCFASINIHLRPSQIGMFTATLILSRTVYILPGNLGLAELICGALSQYMGTTLGSGVLVASLFRIMDYLIIAVLSIIFGKSLAFSHKTQKTDQHPRETQ